MLLRQMAHRNSRRTNSCTPIDWEPNSRKMGNGWNASREHERLEVEIMRSHATLGGNALGLGEHEHTSRKARSTSTSLSSSKEIDATVEVGMRIDFQFDGNTEQIKTWLGKTGVKEIPQ
ncbi:hypothetical protein L1887_08986 [Cichorium endivia]|nr:hypothetical protein L1887_08986 [Cichorium endivia]